MEQTGKTSCQVMVPTMIWIRFRQMCLAERVSASWKVRDLIVAAVSLNELETLKMVNISNELEGAENE